MLLAAIGGSRLPTVWPQRAQAYVRVKYKPLRGCNGVASLAEYREFLMYWDRFDICAAYWWYACEFHGGKRSAEYAIFGRLARVHYKMGVGESSSKRNLTENSRAILAQLVRRFRNGESPIRETRQ